KLSLDESGHFDDDCATYPSPRVLLRNCCRIFEDASFLDLRRIAMEMLSSRRGYTLVEVLVTVAVLGMLLFAVGAAVTHVLDAEMVGAGRQSSFRSADELAARLGEESRSSTAVFVPNMDVLGQSNSGPS